MARHSQRYVWIIAISFVCFWGHGCGSDSQSSGDGSTDAGGLQTDGGEPDALADGDDSDVSDEEAPTIADLRVTFADEVAAEASLNEENQTREVQWPVEATFHVVATDDVTPAKDLAVDVVDNDNQRLTPTEAVYDGGLWEVSLEVRPGQVLRARLTDRAGNQTTSEYVLILPPYGAEEAIVGVWHSPNYPVDPNAPDPQPDVITFSDDGTFRIEDGVFSFVQTGNWSISGDILTLEQTTQTGEDVPTPDSDPDTVEWSTDCGFYVGPEYFAHAPFVRVSDGRGFAGTWRSECTWNVSPSGETGATSKEYVFNSDRTFSSTTTLPSETRTSRGTWHFEGYDPHAQWLVRHRTHQNGEPDGSTAYALVVVRDEQLLWNAAIRQ